jgi:hypothetical protein
MYSNTNYVVLAEIVKNVSGQSLSEYARDKIFVPLRMRHTTYNESFRNVIPNLVSSYNFAGGDKFRKALLNYAYVGSTGVYSTVADLSKWITYISKLNGGNDSLYEKLVTAGKLSSGANANYGAGVFIDTLKGVPRIYHDGYDAAYRSYVALFPAQNVGFILLSNNSAVNPKYYGNLITDLLISGKPGDEKKIITREVKDNTAITPQQRKYAGTYELEDGFVFEIKEDKEGLNVILEGEPFRLYPQTPNKLSVKEFDYNLVFMSDSKGPHEVLLNQNGEIKKGRKVRIVPLAKKSAAEYAGKYYSEEVNQTYDVKIKNINLIISHLKHGEIEMYPFTKDVFRSGISFFDRVRFNRSSKGEVHSFTYLGVRAQGIVFKRLKL